jgi:hypothetical protein
MPLRTGGVHAVTNRMSGHSNDDGRGRSGARGHHLGGLHITGGTAERTSRPNNRLRNNRNKLMLPTKNQLMLLPGLLRGQVASRAGSAAQPAT